MRIGLSQIVCAEQILELKCSLEFTCPECGGIITRYLSDAQSFLMKTGKMSTIEFFIDCPHCGHILSKSEKEDNYEI